MTNVVSRSVSEGGSMVCTGAGAGAAGAGVGVIGG